MSASTFAALLQGFFTDRLLRQMRVSPNTVSGYRDAFRLLLRYATDRLGKAPSDLTLEDFDPPLVLDFLDHLEVERGNTPRTRNNRLAAIRSFFRHVAMNEPAHALRCQRILAIPQKRCLKRTIEFLQREWCNKITAMNYHFGILFFDDCKGVTQIPDVIVAVTHYRYDHILYLFLFPPTFNIYNQLKSKNVLY